ncbi:MAG: 3-phosphoshikimate 1-carboxyvinyltransferase [Candidatus Cloacimonadota bacterium]|nr:MAG: 3-phosphoshikimate 1-carboxyvinyltransferase [Candidatus Cloacimonadota bacterium]PIE81101.1 MAG: 3-phosphoshikimate 1-carboxyvinyltransferase [Candidatus Delongbacteria bacterium]
MNRVLNPSKIFGSVNVPPSKSMMQRAVAISLLTKGKTTISNSSFCNDSKAALSIAKSLGGDVTIDEKSKEVKICGNLDPVESELNCGESGLSLRMFSPIVSLLDREIFINGGGSLVSRPVDMIIDSLSKLGVFIRGNNNLLPLSIKGPITKNCCTIDGSISSQLLTGLLIALPYLKNNSEIVVNNLKSRPYIDMTIDILKDFGIVIENYEYKRFFIKGNQKYQSINYRVEGDWSSGASLLVAGALGGEIEVKGLDVNSKQADVTIVDILNLCGAKVEVSRDYVRVKKRGLKGFNFDLSDSPDLFPVVVALGLNCSTISTLKGVKRLTYKESNRGLVLKKEFEKLGGRISIDGDIMKVYPSSINGGILDSHNDHRIAMSGALASINAKGSITITDSECVEKSYSSFFDDFESICENV